MSICPRTDAEAIELFSFEEKKQGEVESKHGKLGKMTQEQMCDELRGYLRRGKNYFMYQWVHSRLGRIEVPFFYQDGLVLSKSKHPESEVLQAILNIERFEYIERCVAAKKAAMARKGTQ